MTDIENQLQSILDRAEQRERTLRTRALLLTFLPILFAVVLLGVTFWQVRQADVKLNQKADELEKTSQQLTISNQQLTTSNEQLSKTDELLVQTRQQLTQTRNQLGIEQARMLSVTKELDASLESLKLLQDQLEISQTLLITVQHQLSQTLQWLKEADANVIDLRNQLKELLETTEIARALREHEFPHGWESTLKEMGGQYYIINQQLGELFFYIDRFYSWEKPRWNPGGSSIEEGFNSPAFASFVVHETTKLTGVYLSQGELMRALPVRKGKPQLGDVVFYRAGYCMFYFQDESGAYFVIGMTPRGILALDYKFSEVIGIGAVFK